MRWRSDIGWRIAMLLARRNGNRVSMLGGEIADLEDATFGLNTIQQPARYHMSFAFVGAGGIANEADSRIIRGSPPKCGER
ncbi:DeoR family transcriptional regulator [Caballeronia glebae]|uniref:DeoR family transcriptional regulator n=1 Tax=Caballeronia glebae TaxID=1777143 RepID=A0A157Z2H0_9BURK|nr:DeoR family transcriptional regulator [Caballeronia glebae]